MTSMLICAFGASAPFSQWGFMVLGRIMDVLYGSHFRIHCSELSQLRDAWSGRDGRPVLVTTERPEIDLCRLLINPAIPRVAFIEDPVIAIASACTDMSAHEAIRYTTRSFCCTGGVFGQNCLQLKGVEQYSVGLDVFIEQVLLFLNVDADRKLVDAVCNHINNGHSSSARNTVGMLIAADGKSLEVGAYLERLSEQDRDLVISVGEAYRPILEQGARPELEWPRQLFFSSNSVGPQRIDLVGRARCVIWGPYMGLPLGGWRATIECEVIGNLSGNEIEVDISIALEIVANGRAFLPTQGVFAFSIDFVVADPSQQIEVRIHLLKGAIEGQLALRNVVMAPLDLAEKSAANTERRRIA